jgi:hypothetical protein
MDAFFDAIDNSDPYLFLAGIVLALAIVSALQWRYGPRDEA